MLFRSEPDLDRAGHEVQSVLHLDCMLRAAHLIGVPGDDRIPKDMRPWHSLDAFKKFYVNKYIDHHAHTIAF